MVSTYMYGHMCTDIIVHVMYIHNAGGVRQLLFLSGKAYCGKSLVIAIFLSLARNECSNHMI